MGVGRRGVRGGGKEERGEGVKVRRRGMTRVRAR